jgi:hypothetical protein
MDDVGSAVIDTHIRLKPREYEFVVRLASERDESICRIIRHLIRVAMRSASSEPNARRNVGPRWDQKN